MSTGTLTPALYGQEIDANGDPISGALIYTYVAGTTTPATTYTTATVSGGGAVANSNPIEADSAGRWVAFLVPGNSYKFVLCLPVVPIPPPSSPPSAYRTVDNVQAIPGAAQALDLTGTLGETVVAGNLLYLSDGSGGKTQGRWYLGSNVNAYSSVTPETGFAVNDGSAGDAIAIRQGGQVTGLSGLTAGASYYVDTAGAITATVPLNARLVGQADSTTTLIANGGAAVMPALDNGVNDFRLTLTTGVPVTTADVLAATTIFCTPYVGNRIALYNSIGGVSIRTSAQFSIAVPNTTSQMYDIFCYDNAGVPTLELLAWSSDTARATDITRVTTGVETKVGDLTRRYLGSFRTTGSSGQTEDSFAKRYLWNYYNRVIRPLRVTEATNSWTYSTASYQIANAAAGNQLDVVIGVAEVMLDVRVQHFMANDGGHVGFSSIGEDSVTVPATGVMGQAFESVSSGAGTNTVYAILATLVKYPAVGRHVYAWLERASAVGGVSTWYGDDNGSTLTQSGIAGSIQG